MKAPGEELIIRMWDTITRDCIGGLLKPWQTRRMGKANTDVLIDEKRELAQLEKDLKTIQSPCLLTDSSGSDVQQEKIEPTLDLVKFEQMSNNLALQRNLKEEINISKAILIAEEKLSQSTSEANDKEVESDWMYSWREKTKGISSEEMQRLWGNVLAGEIVRPGTYSLRTLELLKNISKDEAEVIVQMAPFVFDNSILQGCDDTLKEFGLDTDKLLLLQEIGVLVGVDSIGLTINYGSRDENKFVNGMKFGNKFIVVRDSDPKKTLTLSVISLTRQGIEIMSLCEFEENVKAMDDLARRVKEKGFQVYIAEKVTHPNGRVTLKNETPYVFSN
ncbi:Protein of unknown function [Methylobacillus rhizosphaerae]|uniref:TIGR03899 family protein n=1 Tax=Methylobacillus rhizosphaerae TaxID=551994 RepID=A0A238YRS7_9PROT|nr:DUF2806 domain-containing protein [Methylobacillus rhizosphaerae]SNR73391.1 Protein of unknown function [Methylobacillus rhizosphaerae]